MSVLSRRIKYVSSVVETIPGVKSVRLSSHFTYVPDPVDSRIKTTGKWLYKCLISNLSGSVS